MLRADDTSGCTANVCVIHKGVLYCANAGDSRTVICRNGKAKIMSKDHKPELKKEKLRICRAGGKSHIYFFILKIFRFCEKWKNQRQFKPFKIIR